MNFRATNEFTCPHCQSVLDTAAAYMPEDKPKDGSWTICNECAGICIYVIQDGIISLRQPTEKELGEATGTDFWLEVQELVDFVKSKPSK